MHRTTQRIDGGNINSVGSNADFGTQGLKTCTHYTLSQKKWCRTF